jgi:hypothetical protein
MQKRATQDLAGHGEAIEQLLARTKLEIALGFLRQEVARR